MKHIIITGANGNLGTAVTKKFLENGYKVTATVISEQDKATMPLHEHLNLKIVDLLSDTASEQFINEVIAEHGQVHGAIVLVGGYASGNVAATPTATVTKMIGLNFNTAYNIARPLLAHFEANGYGRLVFTGARPALKNTEGKSSMAYALSKSLLFKLADFVNEEHKGKNITATVIVPSTIDTPQNRTAMPDKDPANWVEPQQIADVLAFICSDGADALRESVIKIYNNA